MKVLSPGVFVPLRVSHESLGGEGEPQEARGSRKTGAFLL